MSQFENLWRENYGAIPPLGYRLRESFPNRWIRFHSLPNSKRYADTHEERTIILNRANELACEILNIDEPFWLAASRMDENPEMVNYGFPPFTVNSRQLPKVYGWMDPEDQISFSTYSKQTSWQIGEFDDVFSKIAEEEDYGVIFATLDLSSIFIPYDGGFDIIISNPKRVAELNKKYSNYLSTREDGL